MRKIKENIKHTKTKGRVKVLRATLYKSHMIYIRMIGNDYFEYLAEYNGEIYSGYIIITPAEGKKKLTKTEIDQCSALIYAGAEATLDELLGEGLDKMEDEAKKKYVELFEENREKVEGEKKDA